MKPSENWTPTPFMHSSWNPRAGGIAGAVRRAERLRSWARASGLHSRKDTVHVAQFHGPWSPHPPTALRGFARTRARHRAATREPLRARTMLERGFIDLEHECEARSPAASRRRWAARGSQGATTGIEFFRQADVKIFSPSGGDFILEELPQAAVPWIHPAQELALVKPEADRVIRLAGYGSQAGFWRARRQPAVEVGHQSSDRPARRGRTTRPGEPGAGGW